MKEYSTKHPIILLSKFHLQEFRNYIALTQTAIKLEGTKQNLKG
jgi:hypothetical protein